MQFKLQQVEFMPSQLEQGVLYYSKKFGTAAHLCACGCGSKIRTPIAPTEWAISEGTDGPNLWPSVGNWQQACRSHYFISNGQVEWALQWSETQIVHGRLNEEKRRMAYYADRERRRLRNPVARVWAWAASWLGRVYKK
jgi:hypothetical protein